MGKNKKSSSSENDYVAEELKQLHDKVAKLSSENSKLIKIIKDNELEDEIDGIDNISMEESICINGIRQLADLFEKGSWGKDEVQAYDLLHKNYRMIKGNESKPKKQKKADVGELLNIVKGFDAK